MTEKSEHKFDENLVKRIDALTLVIEFIQNRVVKLEADSDDVRSTLTQLQISMGSLNEYLERQRKLEDTIQHLITQINHSESKVENLNESLKKVENLLLGLILAMIPGICGALWELWKVFSGIK